MNGMYANASVPNIMAYITNLFTFSSQLIMSNFSSILIVFHQFFICTALGDADLCFSLMFVPKANDDDEGIT